MCIENGEDKQNEHQQRVSSLAFSFVSIAPTVFINVLSANNISNLFEILSFALNVLSSSVECKREEILLAQGRHITTYTNTHRQAQVSISVDDENEFALVCFLPINSNGHIDDDDDDENGK